MTFYSRIHDKTVVSVYNETELSNAKQSVIATMQVSFLDLWTRWNSNKRQVYECFVSHHMTKVFERLLSVYPVISLCIGCGHSISVNCWYPTGWYRLPILHTNDPHRWAPCISMFAVVRFTMTFASHSFEITSSPSQYSVRAFGDGWRHSFPMVCSWFPPWALK